MLYISHTGGSQRFLPMAEREWWFVDGGIDQIESLRNCGRTVIAVDESYADWTPGAIAVAYEHAAPVETTRRGPQMDRAYYEAIYRGEITPVSPAASNPSKAATLWLVILLFSITIAFAGCTSQLVMPVFGAFWTGALIGCLMSLSMVVRALRS